MCTKSRNLRVVGSYGSENFFFFFNVQFGFRVIDALEFGCFLGVSYGVFFFAFYEGSLTSGEPDVGRQCVFRSVFERSIPPCFVIFRTNEVLRQFFPFTRVFKQHNSES